MEALNRSSSTDLDAANAQEVNEHLYIMTEAPAQERASEHVQLVDTLQIKKTASVDLQVGTHTTRFILDSGATCNTMCTSEYKKMKNKHPLSPSTVDVFTWSAKQPVVNMGKFMEMLTYNGTYVGEEVHVLR
ncbi:hypothetical protein NDU88_009484 [Pleurodeles waltl]|uniref:Uncharacterized protein n=1 Tax=Pleurodeles waltl TaxID=8319 RepID=A0AAV7PUT4_PLEWA|nr:hypothetical protein NDU88_009484 [Pleurodeles waltl]